MGAARNAVPKWVEPDGAWEVEAAADSMAEDAMTAPDNDVDRFHNHEELSPEAMAKAIAELKADLKSVSSRLAVAEETAAGAQAAARNLGTGMVQIGDTLTKRVLAVEEAAIERAAEADAAALKARRAARKRTRQLSMAAVGLVVIVGGGAILLNLKAPATHAGPPGQVLYSPDAPAPSN